MFELKWSIKLSLPLPISAGKYSAKDRCRIEIGCAFFVPFFAQAKKGNTKGKLNCGMC
jgi:hypothetical protein